MRMTAGQEVSTTLVLALFVLAMAGCATTPAAPPSVDVTGKWQGTWQFENASIGSGQVVLTLKQDGGNVTGDALVSGPAVNRPSTVGGIVAGNEFRLVGPYLSGSLMVAGNEMKGIVNGILPAHVTLRKQ